MSSNVKKTVLVSGSTGQLGQELQAISKHYRGLRFFFKNRKQLDLSKASSIKSNLAERSYDYFINAGAYTAVDKAETEVEMAYKVNSKALSTIGKSCPKGTKIIHVSSDYVYHQDPGRPLLETDKTGPKGIYAKSKLEGEEALLQLRPDALIIRTSWVYSSFGNNFVKTMLRLGKDRDALTIVADQLGSPTYARDLAHALVSCIENNQVATIEPSQKRGVYNFSNSGLTNWADFAREIFRQTKTKCLVGETTTKAYNAPAPRPLWSLMDKTKIQRDFHVDLHPWQKSLTNCLKELGYRKQ